MTESALQRILRNVLVLSASAPLVFACGGRATSGAEEPDASPNLPDGDVADRVVNNGCAGQFCGGDCASGCTLDQFCTDGVLQCSCVCEPPPDAGHDASLDASRDASDPCTPDKSQCPYVVPLSCTDASAPDGGTSSAECMQLCETTNTGVFCNLTADGQAVQCYAMCGVGRRAAGMGAKAPRRGSLAGRYFASAAQLEAASIGAFRTLRAELRAHGAPAHLLDAASRAASDEVRHARITARLARRYGAKVPRVTVRRPATRSLETLAIENAVEGCVRETFGALTAMVQAKKASDPKVRAVMASIAPDETRHAALGWAVARWAEARLDTEARARVAAARRAAVAELRAEVRKDPPSALIDVTGLPGAAHAERMIDEMERALWS